MVIFQFAKCKRLPEGIPSCRQAGRGTTVVGAVMDDMEDIDLQSLALPAGVGKQWEDSWGG